MFWIQARKEHHCNYLLLPSWELALKTLTYFNSHHPITYKSFNFCLSIYQCNEQVNTYYWLSWNSVFSFHTKSAINFHSAIETAQRSLRWPSIGAELLFSLNRFFQCFFCFRCRSCLNFLTSWSRIGTVHETISLNIMNNKKSAPKLVILPASSPRKTSQIMFVVFFYSYTKPQWKQF